jgi:hypothetical protein
MKSVRRLLKRRGRKFRKSNNFFFKRKSRRFFKAKWKFNKLRKRLPSAILKEQLILLKKKKNSLAPKMNKDKYIFFHSNRPKFLYRRKKLFRKNHRRSRNLFKFRAFMRLDKRAARKFTLQKYLRRKSRKFIFFKRSLFKQLKKRYGKKWKFFLPVLNKKRSSFLLSH